MEIFGLVEFLIRGGIMEMMRKLKFHTIEKLEQQKQIGSIGTTYCMNARADGAIVHVHSISACHACDSAKDRVNLIHLPDFPLLSFVL